MKSKYEAYLESEVMRLLKENATLRAQANRAIDSMMKGEALRHSMMLQGILGGLYDKHIAEGEKV